jgi:hypothetical protein
MDTIAITLKRLDELLREKTILPLPNLFWFKQKRFIVKPPSPPITTLHIPTKGSPPDSA